MIYHTCSECDFGYVGANCSIVCQCNGHSNCQGPDQLDVCLECHNNTIGNQCEQCQPLYVGDPRDNGECVSCSDYCHGHTDLCVERTANITMKSMNRDELLEALTRGPIGDAVCLGCKNQTTEDRCEGCTVGYFRGSEEFRLPCRKCHCQVCATTTGAIDTKSNEIPRKELFEEKETHIRNYLSRAMGIRATR